MNTADTTPGFLPLTAPPPRRFQTSRLALRAIEATDDQVIFDLYASNPEATRYMSFKCASSLEETAPFVKSAARYFSDSSAPIRQWVWVLELLSTGEPIGTVGIGPAQPFSLGGGYILNPKWWGKGYAAEAWSCVLSWAREQPGVYRIEAVHDLDNPVSGKVMLKAGMTFEGILRRQSIHPNVSDLPRDVAMYAWARP